MRHGLLRVQGDGVHAQPRLMSGPAVQPLFSQERVQRAEELRLQQWRSVAHRGLRRQLKEERGGLLQLHRAGRYHEFEPECDKTNRVARAK